MDGPGEYYANRNRPVTKRQIPNDFTHLWTVMNKLNQQAKQKEPHRWTTGCQLSGWGWGLEDWVGGIEQKEEREKQLLDVKDSVVTVGRLRPQSSTPPPHPPVDENKSTKT